MTEGVVGPPDRRAQPSHRNERQWLTSLPRPAGIVPRPETLQLFGCYVTLRRHSANESQDHFAAAADHSERWIRSVERGECCPTVFGFESLRNAMDAPIGSGDEPTTVFQELDAEPFGTRAVTLREAFGLPSPSLSERHTIESTGLVPLLHEASYTLRLLALTPAILLVGMVGLVVLARPWRGTGLSPVGVDFGAVGLLGLGAVALAILVLPTIDELLATLCALTRRRRSRERFQLIREMRIGEHGNELPGRRGWYVEAEAPYLMAEVREECRSRCLEADLLERLMLVFGTTAVACAGALCLAIVKAPEVAGWWAWLVPLTLSAIALAAVVVVRPRIANAAYYCLSVGYGIELTDAESDGT